jgi:hypothetical protein
MLAVTWPDLDSIGPQPVGQLHWGHVRGLIDRLPPLDSDLAQRLVKDPYVFEHLAMVDEVKERRVELGLRLDDPILTQGVEAQMRVLEPHLYERVST